MGLGQPQDQAGTGWKPTLEAAAVGIATADFGPADTILMGVSAARLHGAIPRAIGTAVVAVPEQRAAIKLVDRAATVRFVKRDTARLDAEHKLLEEFAMAQRARASLWRALEWARGS